MEINLDSRSFPILSLDASTRPSVPSPLLIEDIEGVDLYPNPPLTIFTELIAPKAFLDEVVYEDSAFVDPYETISGILGTT